MATKTNSITRSASSCSSSPPTKRQKTTAPPFAASFPRRTLLSSYRCVHKIPHDIWVYKILNPFLDLKALATAGRCNTFFQEYWEYVLKQNVIRVPEGCPTMNQALDLAVVFSERNECTRENPVKVEVGEGEHAMVGADICGNTTLYTAITCNNITIVGKGKRKTIFCGGFDVNGKQNVKIQQLSVTNVAGHGLYCRGARECWANVELTECCFESCRDAGIHVCYGATTVTAVNCDFMKNRKEGVDVNGAITNAGGVINVRLYGCTTQRNNDGLAVNNWATVTATQCKFMENLRDGVTCGANTNVILNDCKIHHNGCEAGLTNGNNGLVAHTDAVVDLQGTKTDIHSNKGCGIFAFDHAKVSIHLPSQHNTSHDNVGEDRHQEEGGSIANINADGTFTHVVVDEHDGWVTE